MEYVGSMNPGWTGSKQLIWDSEGELQIELL